MNAEWLIQEQIFNKLNTGLSVPVYDFVPQENDDKTYVTIGEDTFSPYNTDGNTGYEATIVIHSWQLANGRKGCKLLQGEIMELLDRAELVITGYNFIGIDFEFSDTTPLEGNVFHGIQRFRIKLMEQ